MSTPASRFLAGIVILRTCLIYNESRFLSATQHGDSRSKLFCSPKRIFQASTSAGNQGNLLVVEGFILIAGKVVIYFFILRV